MSGGERGGGVDVSLNGVSGPTLDTDWKVIRKRGRWVIYGWSGGRGKLDTGGVRLRRHHDHAVLEHCVDRHARARRRAAFIRDWLEREPLIEPTLYPLDEVAAVERAMEQGKTSGKVVWLSSSELIACASSI